MLLRAARCSVWLMPSVSSSSARLPAPIVTFTTADCKNRQGDTPTNKQQHHSRDEQGYGVCFALLQQKQQQATYGGMRLLRHDAQTIGECCQLGCLECTSLAACLRNTGCVCVCGGQRG